MAYDLEDTIAAIASASAGGIRGLVRISGPEAIESLSGIFVAEASDFEFSDLEFPQKIHGAIRLSDKKDLPCELFVWPTKQSYTRQPTIEIHTIGSIVLLQAVLKKVCENRVRLAEPGEFTLRAFLAGRIDLTQAEAVLGVIDSRGEIELQSALKQLAGGLSKPLSQIRENLITVLAELEAGLDFVEEDIEFISSDRLVQMLQEALNSIEATAEQLNCRADSNVIPRVTLVGRPNAGKSSLFNALVDRSPTNETDVQALVSEKSGTTRDYLTAIIRLGESSFELVDTAGEEINLSINSIQHVAQRMTAIQNRRADIVLRCIEINDKTPDDWHSADHAIVVRTKLDLVDSGRTSSNNAILCSSQTGEGLEQLQDEILKSLSKLLKSEATGVASTTLRCEESLKLAQAALSQSIALAENSEGEELVAAEIRTALHEIGRVVGTVYTDDILDRIFSQFCIGK